MTTDYRSGAAPSTTGATDALEDALSDARQRLLDLVVDLDDGQWMGPRLAIVNPISWEIGHVAWFQERWVLRHAGGAQPLRADGDALYDSAKVAHDTRWDLPLPSRAGTLDYMRRVLEASLDFARRASQEQSYFVRLAVFHEDMHGEALAYTRQTLGYPEPAVFAAAREASAPLRAVAPATGDVNVAGGSYRLGAEPGGDPFVFDNEKWSHEIDVAPFSIARSAVTNAQLCAFVEAGGYEDRRLWSEAGWRWRIEANATCPVYWRRTSSGVWQVRRYDRWIDLPLDEACIHVCWFEAEAFCAWAGRRLPTEAEWELAASGIEKRRFPWGDEPVTPPRANLDGRAGGTIDASALEAGDAACGCRQMMGNVWEWTSSDFAPYPGFVVDPYAEYSAPWFATPHKTLRGGCWATRARLLRNTWRNFYPPHRRDVFAGFRTCAR